MRRVKNTINATELGRQSSAETSEGAVDPIWTCTYFNMPTENRTQKQQANTEAAGVILNSKRRSMLAKDTVSRMALIGNQL